MVLGGGSWCTVAGVAWSSFPLLSEIRSEGDNDIWLCKCFCDGDHAGYASAFILRVVCVLSRSHGEVPQQVWCPLPQ